ncbi:MAG: hypothetical protein WDN30_11830 [Pararobbsia sp.]
MLALGLVGIDPGLTRKPEQIRARGRASLAADIHLMLAARTFAET